MRQPASVARLEPWDPLSPLILQDPVSAPTLSMRFGIGGDPIELHQNLHACLRVGRMDRAAAIIKRLKSIYNPSAIEVIEAYNAYLQTMLELAQQQDLSRESMVEIERWYDENIVRQAIEPNANTFITLLRAAMVFLKGQERHATLEKYLAVAEELGPGITNAINESEEFDDQEWDELIRAQPHRFEKPPALEAPDEISLTTPAAHAALVEHGILANPAYKVREVKQKGRGLIALKESLGGFAIGQQIPYPHEMEGTKEEKDRAYGYMRQMKLERDAADAAVARWKAEDDKLQAIGIHGVLNTKPVQALMWHWYSALLPLVEKEYMRTKEVISAPSTDNQHDERHIYGPYLEMCTPRKMTALTVSRVLQACARGQRADFQSLKVGPLAALIGDDIVDEVNSDALQKHIAQVKKERKLARKTLLDSLSKTPTPSTPATPVQPGFESFLKKAIPTSIKTRLGAMLLENFIQAATITVTAQDPSTGKELTNTQAAFHHHTGFANGKKTGWIVPHHEILAKLTVEPVTSIATLQLPMVFEPKPWTSFDNGAYYLSKGSVVRIKGSDNTQRAYAESAISNNDMDKVLKGLDVLGKVPWQINEELFAVMVQAWNDGEGIGAMVPKESNLKRPEEPSETATKAEHQAWVKNLQQYENALAGFHSQRCFQNFQLEIARAYINEEKMYFPHSVDFRGRAYPIPPLLNHIGSDFARSLLRFANGKELGSVGLMWLKVHMANLYGFDKASLREREQFTMDNIHEIYDSAINPLSGRRWWAKAEDPWQCLACCIELKNALDAPDPTRYISHLPVHQDGTCNGLQHYAALGGDRAGASQVNLEPSDRPQDIYTGVAHLVREMVTEDAAKGNAIAMLVDGKIVRKVVKRTVMTNVYGVTLIGAKLQVLDELKDIFPDFQGTKEVKHLGQVALYVVQKIFTALGKIFNGAQEIQHWLGECGARITTSLSPDQIRKILERKEGKGSLLDKKYKQPKQSTTSLKKKYTQEIEALKTSIIWTTPLKMPVVQPYRKEPSQVIKTKLQDISFTKRGLNSAVDKRKQLQAFPPNFIHSLDATHMILSALKCNEMGLDFAAVHDSFWTHAADIPNLNAILRDAFVRMHSEDIIGRLAAEFEARYAGSMYRCALNASSAAAKKIIAWRRERYGVTKVFSKLANPKIEEVALEAKRQELLKSEDAELRKQGQDMITPTSIWLANQDPAAMASNRLALLGETSSKSAKKVAELADDAEIGSEMDAGILATDDLDDLDAVKDLFSEAYAKKVHAKSVHVWVPLTFPSLPKKGSWDISRLRESKYFFS